MPERLKQLEQWLRRDCGLPAFDIAPASSDASFRRYFRVAFDGETRIAMDAPPDKENTAPFIRVAELMSGLGLHVPQVLERDMENGFLLLTDLGTEQYLPNLDEGSVGSMYSDAIDSILRLQAGGPRERGVLPAYSRELLNREMELFPTWFLGRHLGVRLDATEQEALYRAFAVLADNALEQPQVAVHRDYHSRNLMVSEPNPGILDFQDAVVGAFTYDLVSLLRDCYIDWPRPWVEQWALAFHDLALEAGITVERDQKEFLRWFDLMGVQRHLKAIGIFARLNHRDGKPGYLDDIPRTLDYVIEVAVRYRDLQDLHRLIEERVLPAMHEAAREA